MKTAMTELIGWIDKLPAYGLSRADVRHKVTELLEKEKQIIIDAYNEGYRDCESNGGINAIGYYNNTFNQ